MLVGGLHVAQAAIERVAGINGGSPIGLVEELDRLKTCRTRTGHREPAAGALLERRRIAGRQRVPQIAERLEHEAARGADQGLSLSDRALNISLVAQHRLACR